LVNLPAVVVSGLHDQVIPWSSTTRSAATGAASRPHRRRQADPGLGVRLRRSAHRRRHLLGDHAAPPPRRVDHRRGSRAARSGGAGRLWPVVRLELEQLAVDGCTTKAPCGGQPAGPSPVDRRKQGRKRLVAAEAGGIPLGGLPDSCGGRRV